jgi:hypothetical protein
MGRLVYQVKCVAVTDRRCSVVCAGGSRSSHQNVTSPVFFQPEAVIEGPLAVRASMTRPQLYSIAGDRVTLRPMCLNGLCIGGTDLKGTLRAFKLELHSSFSILVTASDVTLHVGDRHASVRTPRDRASVETVVMSTIDYRDLYAVISPH